MAAITCVPDGKTIPLGPSETILEAVLRADIPHAHACGGRGKCSTCRIVILGGLENCSPRTETEQAMASRLGFALEVRLACQAKTQGDVSFRRLVLDETDCEVASQLLKKRTGPVGESKPIAVLFSDIRGFTTLAQRLSPYDVMFALNRHFHELGEIVESNGGYIDNFIGDELMALFGVGGDKSAPFRSVKAAVEMLQANDRMAPYMEATYGHAFPIGIGVHYGEAVIGTLGSSGKEKLTAIGDTVNVASRIEAANKEAGTRLLISSELYELVKDDLIMEDFIRVKLRGTSERVTLYEISGIRPAALARDCALRSADPSTQRYAGKTWTAVLNEDELPAAGRKLVEMEAFDLVVIRSGEYVFAFNNACPHLHYPFADSDVTEEGVLICKWHQSCFDLFTGAIKSWCPGLEPDGTLKDVRHPALHPDGVIRDVRLKLFGNVSKNRTPLAVFPARVNEGKIWVAFE
jgi:class 3 adenylate cyclase/nitrite reductase/ring-hydroxylating ferredoxin subunit